MTDRTPRFLAIFSGCLLCLGLFLFHGIRCSTLPARKSAVYQTEHLIARGLNPFFRKLADREKGKEVLIRILFFGDSIISGDNLTSQLRRKLQGRFGDGGAGIVNIVTRRYSRLRHSRNLSGGGFRLLFIPFSGLSMPAYPHLGFTGQSVLPLGAARAVQRSDGVADRVRFILRAPEYGGTTRLTFAAGDRRRQETVTLAGNECREVQFTNGVSHRVQTLFQPLRGRTYIDAMVLENRSGVTLSTIVNLGLHQAWMQGVLDHSFECGFRLFAPDLIVFQSGINEAATMRNRRVNYTMEHYPRQLDDYYQKLATQAPGVPVLVVGPPERMIRSRRGWIAQPEVAPVARHQEEIAARRNHSFFNTYTALGGAGQMMRMMKSGEAHGDGTHISFRGGELVTGLLFDQLMAAFERYKDD